MRQNDGEIGTRGMRPGNALDGFTAAELEGEAREPAENLNCGYPVEGGRVIGYRYDCEKGTGIPDCCGFPLRRGYVPSPGMIGRIRRLMPWMKGGNGDGTF